MLLTYTREMKEQDKLWGTENEDCELMGVFYDRVMLEAKEQGFKGEYIHYGCNGEQVIEIYDNMGHKVAADLGLAESYMFGNVKAVIDFLENDWGKNNEPSWFRDMDDNRHYLSTNDILEVVASASSHLLDIAIKDMKMLLRSANAHWNKHGLSGLDSISRDIMRTNESIQLLNDYIEGAREENLEEVMALLDECDYIISV